MPKLKPSEMPVVLDTRVVAGSGGGPDKTILNSPRFLTGAGYRMLCAYMHPPGDPGFEQLRARAAALGAPLLSVPDRGAWDCSVMARLLHICRRERVRIWHGHDYKSNALGLLLRRFWPMRLVTTLHGWVTHTRRTPLYYRIDELCLPRYEAVICVSEDLQQRGLACGVPADRCMLIENGIDISQYARRLPMTEARTRLGLSAHRLVLGAVGRLSPEKGFDLLIRAVQRLLQGGLDIELVIAGEGDDRSRLERLINELGVCDRVRLLGYCADPRAIYEALDLFVLSSLREGLPNVLLEAMALEVPVVATRVNGIPRLIQDDDNGLLIPPDSVEQLAQAVTRLAGSEGLRTRLGHAGRRMVEARYSFAVRMQRIAALYDKLLNTEKPNRQTASRGFTHPEEGWMPQRAPLFSGTDIPGSHGYASASASPSRCPS
jgi:glycosyltransferase involved in cell wall biosynthesis